MREPPFEHCDHCPLTIRLLDACPVTPFYELYKEQGLSFLLNLDMLYELVLVLASLAPWIFSLFLFYKLVTKRDVRYMIRSGTHLAAHITCDVVKVVYFREDRPHGSCSLKFGLPSCHSIFAGLYTSWILIEVFLLHRKFKKTYLIPLISMAIVPYSRIFLIYHTLKQCIYGWLIGTVFAMFGSYLMQMVHNKKKVKHG